MFILLLGRGPGRRAQSVDLLGGPLRGDDAVLVRERLRGRPLRSLNSVALALDSHKTVRKIDVGNF